MKHQSQQSQQPRGPGIYVAHFTHEALQQRNRRMTQSTYTGQGIPGISEQIFFPKPPKQKKIHHSPRKIHRPQFTEQPLPDANAQSSDSGTPKP